MKDVLLNVFNALFVTGPERTILSYEANPVIRQMQQLKRDSQSDILFLLDNVDQFMDGDEEKANFVTFLQRLRGPKTGKSKLKILLTSRTALRHGDSLDVENYEVKALDKASSSALLQTQGTRSLEGNQSEKLIQMCQGNPLILNGMAAILRQEIADAEQLLKAIELHEQEVVEPPETGLPPTEKDEKEILMLKKKELIKSKRTA
ncbi:hypothetical protein OS493_038278 [Desmophyllum pertusum]|uniref:Uncharacterized protein n=1 Tax=Desmophyllum pertusum TaxID=174260 RepID=A0A9W9ZWB5_9CNID|nr:hypothetical protein OS493_038278 [Desmophyllum pertusum]